MNAQRKERGVVIFVVLIAVVAMAAGLTAMLAGVRGQSESVRAIVARQEHRLAARSAAYAISAEIYQQRDLALAGRLPELGETEDVLRYEDAPAWHWKLEANDSGQVVEPFAARLDVNHVNGSVVRAFLESNDLDAGHLLGHRPMRSLGMIRHAVGQSDGDDVSHLLTISSSDPQLRTGAGNQTGFVGDARVVPGSNDSAPSGLSTEGAAFFERMSSGVMIPLARGEILAQLRQRAVPADEWDVLLDAFDLHDGKPEFGLVDLSHAPATILAGLPGIDDELAESLVDQRESLTTDDLAGLSWPVRDEILSVTEYVGVIDMLSTRSVQFGVRFAVVLDYDELDDDVSQPPTTRELWYEMVVDVAGDRPRAGYLRDVTSLSWQVQKQQAAAEDADEEAILATDKLQIEQPTEMVRERAPTEPGTALRTQWGRLGTGGAS